MTTKVMRSIDDAQADFATISAAEVGADATGAAAAAYAAAVAASQPLDSDLSAIAALTTTSFGRALLTLADAAAGRTALGLGTAATHATGDFDAAGTAAAAVAALVNSSPAALDTLKELADALGDDPNFATTMTTALAGKQPLDSDLTAIAALTTTSYGRAFLALADAAAARSALALGTAALSATTDFDAAGAAAAAQSAAATDATTKANAAAAASQPLDSDLTAIAALSTTSYGRSVLAVADAAALRTLAALVIGTDVEAHDSDLTSIAGLAPSNDDIIQRKAGAWTNRSLAQLVSDLGLGAVYQPLDADLTALAGLAIAADKLPYGNGSHTMALADFTAAGRALIDDADAAAQRATLGLVPPGPRISGRYYPTVGSGVTNNQADTLNEEYAAMFISDGLTTYDRIAVVCSGAVTSAAVRLGWRSDAGGKPGAVIGDSGQFAAATTGDKVSSAISWTPPAGIFWLSCAMQTSAAGSPPNLTHATGISGLFAVGTTSPFSLSIPWGFKQTGISGALATWATFTEVVRGPIIYVRAA